MLTFILFPLGLYILIKGADLLVEGGASIAKKFGISQLAIGLTVVAFGSSAPEFVVNILASLNNEAGLAFGNIIGSNIANILLILGVSAMISPLVVKSTTAFREIPFSMLAALVLAFLANDVLIDGAEDSVLTRSDGMVLLSFFAVFIFYVYTIAGEVGLEEETPDEMSTLKSVIFVLVGLACLIFGGDWIVDGAVKIAHLAGFSEKTVGLTIVAVGTSLPELATSAVAAKKNRPDMAIGNVVGSNIFNIFWVLGLSAAIQPLPVEKSSGIDIVLVLAASVLLFAFLLIGRRLVLKAWQGLVFLLIYGGYLTYLVIFGDTA